MTKKIYLTLLFGLMNACVFAQTANPEVVKNLLNRIGGSGTADRMETVLDASLAEGGKEVFVLGAKAGKPCITGSTLSAVTAGINWYLNHYAGVNLTWNNLTTDLSATALPVPTTDEKHVCTADYRYYLNYCTFSYSMAGWTWERWQKEIDWMALHGINLPLAVVGADVVWKNVLTELGYSSDEINDFVAGPAFQAWWLMNNLEGWGGANRDWWYTRQETLSKKILARMRELGMKPVLPGYSGMVPSNIAAKKGWTVADPGTWCYFQRPAFLVPTDSHFPEMAALYYKHLAALMGTSDYYSMDPFHEGGNTSGVNLPAAYTAIQTAMDATNANAKWVIQSWNENPRSECLTTIPKGKLLVLDLFSDGTPRWQNGYNGHDMVYCMLHNFGGRTGLHGRLKKTVDGYYEALTAYPTTLKGVGATPEGIETNPMLYDALFELPWTTIGTPYNWLTDYSAHRYGVSENAATNEAWQRLGTSAYNCQTAQQGTSEPVFCARPSLTVNSVSTWSTSTIYYDPEEVRRAASLLLSQNGTLGGNANYKYDVVDVTRQTLSDYGNALLKLVNAAKNSGETALFVQRKDAFLQLILDQNRLLNTCPDFMLGTHTEMAKAVTDEAAGTSAADKNWMDWNIRTQVTVWGTQDAANNGGLHDYSNREWGGLLKDFHYARWQKYFDALVNNTAVPTAAQWYAIEKAWTENYDLSYPNTAQEDAATVAAEVFKKNFGTLTLSGTDSTYIFPYHSENELYKLMCGVGYRGGTATIGISAPSAEVQTVIYADWNNDGTFSADETTTATATGLERKITLNVPVTAVAGRVKARIVQGDATLDFYLTLRDEVTVPRQVSVSVAEEGTGTVKIVDEIGTSVNTKADVTVSATPATNYAFEKWTDAGGALVGTDNPYTYYGVNAINLVAHFMLDKWGTVEEDFGDMGDIQSYEQYITRFSTKNNGITEDIYTATTCPSTLYNLVPTTVSVARGSRLTLSWNDTEANGLSYCCLSAYLDKDADGEFELLTTRGTKESGSNSTVSDGSINIDLPADMPVGITRIRMRYDGAWSGGWDANGAKPAKAATKRMVYDIILNVTEFPAAPVTITAKTTQTTRGTVSISGMDNPATVQPGETIILQAQPKAGYTFNYWRDQYNNKVSTEANYSFIPAESGTFTALFAVSTGIDEAENDEVQISVDGGRVTVVGAENFTLCSIDGARQDATSVLPEGVYIVSTANPQITRKITVKR